MTSGGEKGSASDAETEPEVKKQPTLETEDGLIGQSRTADRENSNLFALCAITCTTSFVSNLINDKARKYYKNSVSTVAFTGYEQGMLFMFAIIEYWIFRGFKWPPFSFKMQSALTSTGIFRVLSRYLGAQALLTYSLDFVSYTILKCGKILVFLFASCFFLEIPACIDISIGFTLFLSLIIFKLPDGDTAFEPDNIIAIACMFASIFITICTTILQEKLMNYGNAKVDALDLMVHAGVIPIIYLFLHILTRGTIDLNVFLILTLQNFFVYAAARLNLQVIQKHGSFVSLVTASIRKVLTICFSIISDAQIVGTDFLGLAVFMFCVFLMVLKGKWKQRKVQDKYGEVKQTEIEVAPLNGHGHGHDTDDSSNLNDLP